MTSEMYLKAFRGANSSFLLCMAQKADMERDSFSVFWLLGFPCNYVLVYFHHNKFRNCLFLNFGAWGWDLLQRICVSFLT